MFYCWKKDDLFSEPSPLLLPVPVPRAAVLQPSPAPVPVPQVGVATVQSAPAPIPVPRVRPARTQQTSDRDKVVFFLSLNNITSKTMSFFSHIHLSCMLLCSLDCKHFCINEIN